jgi:leucyl/phenylalanyl-tRNA--protein transferase
MPIYYIPEELWFPPVEEAEDGLVGIGGDLSSERLLLAYSNGIFPWFENDEEILWWSPDPRMVLFPEKFKISKSLRQSIRNKGFELKIDFDFESVIHACSQIQRPEGEGTWITPGMHQAYMELYHKGYAHSFEIYQNDRLVGGLYGVSLGKAFFGESMFSKVSDASKVALYHLINFAKQNNFLFIDAQVETEHLKRMGAENISRTQFISLLRKSQQSKPIL